MNLLKGTYLREILNKELELLILFTVLLLFPNKSSLIYFLFVALVLSIFTVKNIVLERNLGVSYFSKMIIVVNVLFVLTAFFSNSVYDSILLIADIIIISFYISIVFLDILDYNRFFFLILIALTIFSLLKIINDLLTNNVIEFLLYDNPIRIGIVSGLGTIISLFYLLEKKTYIYGLFILINLVSLYMSSSKGAFLGLAIISLIIILQRNKRMLFGVFIVIILTFIIPNPIKNIFEYSIYKDKYSIDRLDIWKMSLNIFSDNVLFGVGPNNFKNVSKKYNFKQENGPANYFKVPRQTHSDYLKLIAENGLLGILIILFILIGLFRIFKKNRLLDIPISLLLYLLIQALFFNILFKPFFLFTFVLLLKIVFEKNTKYVKITTNLKLITTFTVFFVFITGHLLPFLSDSYIQKSVETNEFSQKDELLKKAIYLTPLNATPLINRSLLNFNAFVKTFEFDFCVSAIDMIKQAKKLSSDNPRIYDIELQYYSYYYKPIIAFRSKFKRDFISNVSNIILKGAFFDYYSYINIYNSLRGIREIENIFYELIDIIKKVEKIDPNNPFLRVKEANLLLTFNRKTEALHALKEAVRIEPEYLDAVLMLDKYFNYYHAKKGLKSILESIKKKRKLSKAKKGSYLYELFNSNLSK